MRGREGVFWSILVPLIYKQGEKCNNLLEEESAVQVEVTSETCR